MDARKLTVTRARALRREMTKPEVILWLALRGGQTGLRFRRQHPIGWYILDFYCADAALCVEVDGPVHNEKAEHDQRRTEWLNGQGIRVIRFSAEDIVVRPAWVVAAIVPAAAPSTA